MSLEKYPVVEIHQDILPPKVLIPINGTAALAGPLLARRFPKSVSYSAIEDGQTGILHVTPRQEAKVRKHLSTLLSDFNSLTQYFDQFTDTE